jgi:hypothetical protein
VLVDEREATARNNNRKDIEKKRVVTICLLGFLEC